MTTSLDTNVQERLAWLDFVLKTVNLGVCFFPSDCELFKANFNQDPDIRDVAPQIMEILLQRLNALYMAVAKKNPHDMTLRLIAPLARRASDLRG